MSGNHDEWRKHSPKARKYWRKRLPLACYQCRRPVTDEMDWSVEHVVRLSEGGPVDDYSTQWVSHSRCNSADGGRTAAKNKRATTNSENRILKWW